MKIHVRFHLKNLRHKAAKVIYQCVRIVDERSILKIDKFTYYYRIRLALVGEINEISICKISGTLTKCLII